MDENAWIEAAGFDAVPLVDLLDELKAVRQTSLQQFKNYDEVALGRSGSANGMLFMVRSVPWVIAGHEIHHMKVVQERYR